MRSVPLGGTTDCGTRRPSGTGDPTHRTSRQRVRLDYYLMDTLGIEPRASRMLSGCDTATPCALQTKIVFSALSSIIWQGPFAENAFVCFSAIIRKRYQGFAHDSRLKHERIGRRARWQRFRRIAEKQTKALSANGPCQIISGRTENTIQQQSLSVRHMV